MLGALSLLILVAGSIPYLSLKLQDAALGSMASDPNVAIARTGLAAWLDFADAGPFQVRAYIYQQTAQAAAVSTNADIAGAVLDDLALALASQDEAVQREPADWNLRYNAGVAALNLLFASEAVTGRAVALPESTVLGLDDWSALAPPAGSSPGTPAAPGVAAGSLATTAKTVNAADHYRQLSLQELLELADRYLAAAHDRYPLSPQVAVAVRFSGLLTTR